MTSSSEKPRASVHGLGLIGSSIALGLRKHGWYVSGEDISQEVMDLAWVRGVLDARGDDLNADVTFVAAPPQATPEILRRLIDGKRVVSDVTSVKAPITEFLSTPTFVAGHPMAGSEARGILHGRDDLFEGATWILSPSEQTDSAAYTKVADAVQALGAAPVVIPASAHDELVGVVSHLPHMLASALLRVALQVHSEDTRAFRLAAGSFRDMTRIGASDPSLWTEILMANRVAAGSALDSVIEELRSMRTMLANNERDGIHALLEAAQNARVQLPGRRPAADDLAELQIPVADRPGALASVTTRSAELSINIYDIALRHSPDGEEGILSIYVSGSDVNQLRTELELDGFIVHEATNS